MMQTAAPVVPSAQSDTATARDMQRDSLDQIVRLSNDCTAEEARIEQEHTDSLAVENAAYEKKIRAAKQRYQRKTAELAASATERDGSIQAKHESERVAIESTRESAQFQLARKKEETDSSLKKQVEQAAWQAESILVTLQMKVDTDEQKFKQEYAVSLKELAELDQLETGANGALARYKVQPFPVETPIDDPLAARLAAEPKAVLAEQRQQSTNLLGQLQTLTAGSMMDDVVPFFLVLALAGVAGAAAWMFTADAQQKLVVAGSAAGGAFVLGIAFWIVLSIKKKKRIRAKCKELFTPFMQALTLARKAATLDPEAAAAAREKRVKDGRKKRDQDTLAAKEKAKALQVQTHEQIKTALADALNNHKNQLAAIDEEKTRSLEELQQNREKITRQIEQEDAATRDETESLHAQTLATIESKYVSEFQALEARWDDGLKNLSDLMSAGSGIDPNLVDWHSPDWSRWKSPAQFSGQVRFGDMKVDLAQLTEQVPKRLKLPGTFSVPALLTMPAHASLLIDADHTGRDASNDMAQLVMARLLTQMPAGRAKFTIFDPVGLGQSFAGFMHLADHDESLVGSRIWTEKDHINQRLADLTEHMETVIQKYLRNEYATIDQYNAQAGELAEPFRFLVIADFPTGFEAESLRRLSSIVMSGPKCGVYTLILRDTRQSIPPGSRMEDITARSVHLQWKNGEPAAGGQFVWDDSVFKKFPLHIDAPPDEKTLTSLMELVGKAAKEAKRVEVPFASIAPKDDQFWTLTSKADLRVPIGKSGATRLQSLRLGIGVAQHTLIAGKTGSGKSNLMHTIVTNLAMWYSPDEVEFYLIDFKKGVEFKAYVTSLLPHARAIAVESDREFGLSVLQRVDAELSRRGTLFRDTGVQDINGYRDRTGQKIPRTILLIDEFQEFFTEDDKLGQEAAGLMDRLVRQGRAFGVHLVLGSQSIGGGSGLGRSTLGQIAVRVALQCSETDSQMILGDNNSAARLLTRPGEAVYNDAGGLVEANSPFQIAFLPDAQREVYLEKIRKLSQKNSVAAPTPIVFEGNSPAIIRKNNRLISLLERSSFPPVGTTVPAYVGEPVAIKEPTSIPFRRQSGKNVLMVGQAEESAISIFASMIASLAAQHAPGEGGGGAIFYLLDGTPTDSKFFGLLEKVLATLPHKVKVIQWRDVPEAINELATMQKERQANEAHDGPSVFLLLFGLQRFRLLRKQEDDFSFGRGGDEPAAPKPDKQFADLLTEGPPHGIHTILWSDTPITLERTLDRSAMRQFDNRILFQMSASDSSNLIDSPLANRLGAHRALLYSEEQGTFEKFRPYQLPDEEWIEYLTVHLKNRPA